MALNINIRSFSPPGATYINALEDSGAPKRLINYINSNGGNRRQQLEALLDCLSQTLSLQGRYQGECESRLKALIFRLAKRHPVDAAAVIEKERFKYNSKLESSIKKIKYISSNYFEKVFHNVKESYTNNKRFGVSYFTTGTTLLLVGGLQTIFSDGSSNKTLAAWATLITGGGMMALPVINSCVLAFKDEP